MPASKVVDLRNYLAERYPQSFTPTSNRFRTGVGPLDEVTGGLPRGAITELTSPRLSAGSALLISTLLHTAHQEGHFMALVDGRDSFDPQPLGNLRLRHLLWIRCRQPLEAVKATDLLLRDGNFPLIILDLVLNAENELRKIPNTTWYRLQRLVESGPAAFLVLTRRSMISSAQLKLVLLNEWNLRDLGKDHAPLRLTIQVERAHGGKGLLMGAG